jgi:hypothetical protein
VAYKERTTWLIRSLLSRRILRGARQKGKETSKVHDDSMTTASRAPLWCPFCEVYEHIGHDSGHCPSCGGFFSEGFLEALRRLTELPDIFPPSLVGASADTVTQR